MKRFQLSDYITSQTEKRLSNFFWKCKFYYLFLVCPKWPGATQKTLNN